MLLQEIWWTSCVFSWNETTTVYCLPAFLFLYQEFETLQQTRILAAGIFPTANHNTCVLSSLCDSQGLFPCLLELSCGEYLWNHIQLHNLDLPASSYSAKVSFCRPQNYQQLFGMIVFNHWFVWPLFQGHLLVIGGIDSSFVHIS